MAPADTTMVFSPASSTQRKARPVGTPSISFTEPMSTPADSTSRRVSSPYECSHCGDQRRVRSQPRGDGLVRALSAGSHIRLQRAECLAGAHEIVYTKSHVCVDRSDREHAARGAAHPFKPVVESDCVYCFWKNNSRIIGMTLSTKEPARICPRLTEKSVLRFARTMGAS